MNVTTSYNSFKTITKVSVPDSCRKTTSSTRRRRLFMTWPQRGSHLPWPFMRAVGSGTEGGRDSRDPALWTAGPRATSTPILPFPVHPDLHEPTPCCQSGKPHVMIQGAQQQRPDNLNKAFVRSFSAFTCQYNSVSLQQSKASKYAHGSARPPKIVGLCYSGSIRFIHLI
jgi:hypothetical protein